MHGNLLQLLMLLNCECCQKEHVSFCVIFATSVFFLSSCSRPWSMKCNDFRWVSINLNLGKWQSDTGKVLTFFVRLHDGTMTLYCNINHIWFCFIPAPNVLAISPVHIGGPSSREQTPSIFCLLRLRGSHAHAGYRNQMPCGKLSGKDYRCKYHCTTRIFTYVYLDREIPRIPLILYISDSSLVLKGITFIKNIHMYLTDSLIFIN